MLMKKFIGKPYAGKPHVRFDEGAGKEFNPSRSTLPVNGFHCFTVASLISLSILR